MFYQINHSNMVAALAEDVYVPELRNPLLSGMHKNRRTVIERIAKHLNRLLDKKQ